MKWFGIIKSIPNTWKKVVKNEAVDLQVEMPLVCDIKILIFCSALCAIITLSTRGRGCGLTWVGGMGCGKLYGRSLMGSCPWCHSHKLKSTLFIYKWSLCFLIDALMREFGTPY